MPDEVLPKELARSLTRLKKKTSWSWETMSREFQRVMGERGPSNTTLYRYATHKVKRRNLVVERYVREAVHKIMLQVVEDELKQSEKQRRDVETKLEQREVRFHQLVENARDVIYRFRVKPVLGCEYVSPRITDLLGYTPEELYADYKLLLRAVHPVDRERLQKSFKGKGQFHERATLRWVHKDGSLVWIERVNVPLYDEKVFKNDHAYYADHVQKKFPEDHWLGENGIESYLAIPVYDPEGKPFGHLGVMHDGPMHDDLPRESILRNFAAPGPALNSSACTPKPVSPKSGVAAAL